MLRTGFSFRRILAAQKREVLRERDEPGGLSGVELGGERAHFSNCAEAETMRRFLCRDPLW